MKSAALAHKKSGFYIRGNESMAEHSVTLKIPSNLEVVNRDIEFRVMRNGNFFGTLKISKGSLDWKPTKKAKDRPFRVYWNEFDDFARDKRRHKTR